MQRHGPADTAALFVRIPQTQARALDRIAFEARRPKQAIVSELLATALEPSAQRRPPALDAAEEGPVVGWHSFRETVPDVLTLDGVAELLGVLPDAVAQLAASGELPGRLIDGQWRFARAAVLAWLGRGTAPEGAAG